MHTQLIKAPWIVPVGMDAAWLTGHCVAIAGDRIVGVIPCAEAVGRFPDAEVLELPSHAVLPGFVNAHTHAAMTLLRGYADDMPLSTWLNQHIWPLEARWVSAEFVRDGVRLAIAEMIGSGTTCFCDMYFFPEVTAAVAVECGMRAAIGMIVVNFASAWASDLNDYFAKGQRVHDQYAQEPLITTLFAPHSPYAVNNEALRRISTLAEELDIQVLTHLHETAHEVTEALRNGGERPLQQVKRHGLLSPRLAAVHMTALDDADIAELVRCGVHVVHCPESNLKLASGICPVPRLARHGVNVALGTDGAASNNDLDMLGEMRTAALLAKGSTSDPTALPALEVLRMATINGARALGLADHIGTIEAGKQADLIAIDLAHPATQPVFDPVSQIVYAAGRDQVSDVWIAGRRVLENRRLTSLDRPLALQRANEWRSRISGT
jgi:5-methylthioadenosine/S-adenosylhomocysteine deaminase